MMENMRYTIMTIPMPFAGNDAITQRNAILSWTLLKPRPEILVLCNEQGVAEFAKEHNLVHIPDVAMTKFGYPSIKSILELGQANSSNELMVYMDTDNILMSDFPLAVWAVSSTFNNFMMGGFRKDDYMTHLIPFEDPNWERDLKDHVMKHGTFFRPGLGSGSDYFTFKRGLFQDVPDFSIGKGHWDGWRMRYVLDHGVEMLDCSDIVFALHQQHPWRTWAANPDATAENLRLAGGESAMRWVQHSTTKLTQEWLDQTLAKMGV